MSASEGNYDFKAVEAKWAKKWEADGQYKTPEKVTRGNKYYILPQLPYPSGSGLHAGHAEVYTACDIYARFKRMRGKKVLQVIGWDSFGLPAENYAIKTNVHPKITTNKAIDNFRYQIKRMGVSVDWSREVGAHNPDYYKWTQWFFLLMLKRGLAYRKKQSVNWCESCKTVLANEQVTDGKCERCGTTVIQREMEQWFLKITEYADRLDKDLDKVDWPTESVTRQRNWIGRKEGINISYPIEGKKETVTTFTTRPDTNFGATFVVVAPDSEFVKKNLNKFPEKEKVAKYVEAAKKKTELERIAEGRMKTGVFTGWKAINQLTGKPMPIFVTDFVLATVGTGAVVGVPGHDKRDFEFAKAKELEVIRVVTEEGVVMNSEFLDGMEIHAATKKIMDYLEEKGWGKRVVNYRLRDWSISRQRFWGAPIPIVFDPEGQPHPVDEVDLPVKLPDDVDFRPTGESPLNYSKEFQKGVEEKYGKGWRREADTLDTFMCSSWYYYRYLDPKNDKAFASQETLKTWMPVDFYIGGPEHVTGHLLYSRFFTKVLFDAGIVEFDEPFLKHRHQGMILGEDHKKMSKRWNNVVNPTEVMDRHGGDALRLYEMFMGPLEETKIWNTQDEAGIARFIKRVWRLGTKIDEMEVPEGQEKAINKLIQKAGEDTEELGFNTAIAAMMECANSLQKEKKIARSVWERYLLVLAPYAPYITEELWEKLGKKTSIHGESWPEVDEKVLEPEREKIVVQVDGKMRGMVEAEPGASEEKVIELAKAEERIEKYLSGGYERVVFVKGTAINFVLK